MRACRRVADVGGRDRKTKFQGCAHADTRHIWVGAKLIAVFNLQMRNRNYFPADRNITRRFHLAISTVILYRRRDSRSSPTVREYIWLYSVIFLHLFPGRSIDRLRSVRFERAILRLSLRSKWICIRIEILKRSNSKRYMISCKMGKCFSDSVPLLRVYQIHS